MIIVLIVASSYGCATIMGFAGMGRDDHSSSSVVDACSAGGPEKVLNRWGEISGSLIVRIIDSTGAFDSGVIQLGSPDGVAVALNELYILDGVNRVILKFDPNSQMVRKRIKLPGLNARSVIHVDRSLSLYVANAGAPTVRQYDVDGRLIQTFGQPAELTDPVGLAVNDRTGNVFVADGLTSRILVFNLQGAVSQVIGSEIDGVRFSSIRDIALAPDQLFVVDGLSKEVHLLSRAGGYRYSFGAEDLLSPRTVVVDDHNRVFVADEGDNTIKVFRGGELLSVIGADDDEDRIHFIRISDMWQSEGMVYVADSGSVSIKIFRVIAPCA